MRVAGLVCQLGDDVLHEVRDGDGSHVVGLVLVPLLLHDFDFELDSLRIVGPDLGAIAVLERRDDPTPVRVVLRVRRRDDIDVERQADLVATDLDVAFFEDVEQADLDPSARSGSSLIATIPRLARGIRP